MVSGPGFQELVLIFVIGLLILGPERLPRVASQLGRWVGKARRTANQLRFQMEREIALADIEKKKPPKSKDADDPADAPASAGPDDGQDSSSDTPATPPSGDGADENQTASQSDSASSEGSEKQEGQ